jgi:glycosyltransferase involved in cell wall biosynthesis
VSVALVIPVFNEEETLVEQVNKLLDFLVKNEESCGDVFIIIADNGSTDETQHFAQSLSASHDRISYIRKNEPGVGIALRTAWKSTDCEIVGFMDLDFSTDLNHLPEALNLLRTQSGDFVYGSRWASKSVVIGRPIARSVSSFVFNFLVRNYFKVEILDAMCGFKFLTRNSFDKLERLGANNNRWFFGTELVVLGHLNGLGMIELPVTWRDDKNSKVKLFRLTVEYILAMKNLKHKIRNQKS